MTKYRVREQYGVFYLEKKNWLFGWMPVYWNIGRYQRAANYPTLDQAFKALEEYQAAKAAPIYHYSIKGSVEPLKPPTNK